MISTLLALPLPIALLLFIFWRTAWQWRALAERYGVDDPNPHTEKLGWLVLRSGALQINSYNGTTAAGVAADHLTLRIVNPFAMFHQPLKIPFSELKIERSRWYMNSTSYMLTARRVPNVGIIMPESYLEWLVAQAGDSWPAGQIAFGRNARDRHYAIA